MGCSSSTTPLTMMGTSQLPEMGGGRTGDLAGREDGVLQTSFFWLAIFSGRWCIMFEK
jgi:hypothetical protein